MSPLTVVAVTHQNVPFAVLERVALAADAAHDLAATLRTLDGVDESVVLSTCNRTELYLAAPAARARAALGVLAAHAGLPVDDLVATADVLEADAASLHLFRVAAGLESRLVGEREVLHQVRAAARAARGTTAGPRLDDLFRWAAATGRRARRAAGGSSRPSVAGAVLDSVTISGGPAVVVGAGQMAAAVTQELRARRIPYRVAARRAERALALVREPADATGLTDLAGEIAAAVLVVCTSSARAPIVTRSTVASGLAHRNGRPLTIVDLSVPRNVAPEVDELAGVELVHLHDVPSAHDDLHVRRVSDVVAAQHARYRLWLAGRAAGPIIAALRDRVTAICRAEAEHVLGPEAEVFARRVAGRVLHQPTLAIKELSAQGQSAALDALAAALGLHGRGHSDDRSAVREAS